MTTLIDLNRLKGNQSGFSRMQSESSSAGFDGASKANGDISSMQSSQGSSGNPSHNIYQDEDVRNQVIRRFSKSRLCVSSLVGYCHARRFVEI